MATQKTKLTVGLFITGGMIIAVLAIIWLGVSRIFEKGDFYTTYFDESVQGLGIDSPVKYRGVPVGRVAEISVAPDSKLIEVVLKVESGQELGSDIVAQLRMVGITGSMFVELDQIKKGDPDRSPALNFTSRYPVVASKPGEIGELLQGVDEALKNIVNLDLEGISDRVKQTLDNINLMVADTNIKKLSSDFEKFLANINTITEAGRWDRIMVSIEEAGQSLNRVMDNANSNLKLLEGTLAKMDGIVTDNEQAIQLAINDFQSAMDNLLLLGRNLSRGADNLNQLIESLAQNPSLLLYGKQPAPRKLEE